MKTIIPFLFALTMAAAAMSQSQPAIKTKKNDPILLGGSYSCPDESVFSQVHPIIDKGFFCQEGYEWYLAVSNYNATGPFSNFRFWGIDFKECTLQANEPFDVIIWDDDPSNGGVEIFSGSFVGTTLDTGELYESTSVYQIDIELGAVINQLSGFIGVTRKNPTCETGTAFAWMGKDDENGIGYSYNGEEWLQWDADFLFCLSYQEPASVPVSKRIIYLTTLLIGAFLLIRTRII